ncbi:MAG: hypothetical protein IPK83_03060 [Planctomycetes bacterium]|nr:hypothetical protein [Planctomycetota bacterium]
MANERAIEVLNRLLAAEFESVAPRLAQADPYVSLPSSDDQAVVANMLRDVTTHERELTQMILSLRGAPVTRRFATDSGGMHYVRLSHLMPSVLANIKQLISLYESSAGTTGSREADGLISRILDNYRRHFAGLEELHANLAAEKAPANAAK